MTERYRVTWVVDIEADTPAEAAQIALTMQRDPESIATVFDVIDDEGTFVERIDLDPEPAL